MAIHFGTIKKAWEQERSSVLSSPKASSIEISMQSRNIPTIHITFSGVTETSDTYDSKEKIVNWLKKFGTVRINDRGVPDSLSVTLD
jgi:hypothetical protein